jgi:hypothetical protein
MDGGFVMWVCSSSHDPGDGGVKARVEAVVEAVAMLS